MIEQAQLRWTGEIRVMTKQGQKATLAQVAAMAEVDVSTASRVLRGQSEQRIRAETRDRILEAAKKLNYRANFTARSLRMSRTFTLGIVVPQLDNPVFSAAIRGAENVAAQHGYSLLISHRDPGEAGTTIAKLSQMNRVDGLLVASLDADEVLRSDLAEANVPYALLNRQLTGACGSRNFLRSGAGDNGGLHIQRRPEGGQGIGKDRRDGDYGGHAGFRSGRHGRIAACRLAAATGDVGDSAPRC